MVSITVKFAKNIFIATSLFLFTVGCVAYAFARQDKVDGTNAAVDKTVVILFEEVTINSEGKETIKAHIVSKLTIGKGWESTRYPAGSSEWVRTSVSESGQESLKSNGQRVQREGHSPNAEMWASMSTVRFYQNNAKYAGEDSILGYQVFKLKYDLPDGSSREATYAPEFGPFRLRYIVNKPNGAKIIQRAVKIWVMANK